VTPRAEVAGRLQEGAVLHGLHSCYETLRPGVI
jgi:hypothetical protein